MPLVEVGDDLGQVSIMSVSSFRGWLADEAMVFSFSNNFSAHKLLLCPVS
jgi:hypothetical protein